MSRTRLYLCPAVPGQIRAHLSEQPRVEHCGLLLSPRGVSCVNACLPFPGPLQARRFELPQDWMLRAFVEQRRLGFRVAGFYHTHPSGAGVGPSARDRTGHPPGSLVLVVSAEDWRAYRVDGAGLWRELGIEPCGT